MKRREKTKVTFDIYDDTCHHTEFTRLCKIRNNNSALLKNRKKVQALFLKTHDAPQLRIADEAKKAVANTGEYRNTVSNTVSANTEYSVRYLFFIVVSY